jgi:hypothetical protein
LRCCRQTKAKRNKQGNDEEFGFHRGWGLIWSCKIRKK